ncbi:hypothetical protein AB0F81_50225 [Actinoplanes sp. NPDC024001]|uniref:hypothetical protein n=1 Tax=Actinoplanes sp. NPDC024001 TaxID=3154598 RepID=UPI0033DED72D
MGYAFRRVSALCCAGLMSSVTSGCGDGTAERGLPSTGTAASSPTVLPVTGADIIGETITASGTVTDVIGPTSFEMDSPGYGDGSLLVLCAEKQIISPGQKVEVSGSLQIFSYRAYADEYALVADSRRYAEFETEPFLVTLQALDLP